MNATSKKLWTDEDIKFIRLKCQEMTDKQLSEALDRSVGSIKSKKLSLGLVKNFWSKEEDNFIVNNYKTMSLKELATKFGRTELAIQNRKNKLGLTEPQVPTKIEEVPETTWTLIKGYERYAVSPLGLVLNVKKGIVLKNFLNNNGYVYVTLFNEEGKKNIKVHRIVGEHLVEKPTSDEPLVINHKDGDKTNPSASNLEWVTYNENSKHAYKTGLSTPLSGTRNPRSKVSEQDVHDICKWLENGLKTKEIIGLSSAPLTKDIIGKIKTGKNWVNISIKYNIK